MDTSTQKLLLLSRVKMLIRAYEERFGSNPYADLDLETQDSEQLASIGRALHEVLYTPPSRNR